MTGSAAGGPGVLNECKLPRRDWILLPALSLLTIGLILGSLELIGTWMFPWGGRNALKCMVLNDASTGVRGVPNSACWGRLSEGQPIEYRFNSHGDRTRMQWGPKAPGAYRIVTPGSSFVFGDGVAMEKTFTALLPSALSDMTGRNVEVYNEGIGWGFPRAVALRFNDAVLAAKPDMVLWVLTPTDIQYSSELGLQPAVEVNGGAGKSATFWEVARDKVKDAFAGKSIPEALSYIWDQTRTAFLLRHYLYRSQSQYLKNAVRGGDSAYLRSEPDADWQNHLRQFDRYAAEIEEKARIAGVPVVTVLVPLRAQAALLSLGEWPADTDPYKVDRDLASIIASHGGTYIDILPAFRKIPNPEQYYLPVDGHLAANGNALVSDLLAKALTSGKIPALRTAEPPRRQGQ